jgi:hypothetical protein
MFNSMSCCVVVEMVEVAAGLKKKGREREKRGEGG